MSEQEIPADLLQTARQVRNRMAIDGQLRMGDPVRTVAAALLAERTAERERCVERVAEIDFGHWERWSDCEEAVFVAIRGQGE